MKYFRFQVPYPNLTRDTVIQWETPIGAWLSHNLPHIYIYIWIMIWPSGSICGSLHDPHHVVSVGNYYQTSCKISNFGHPISTKNGILYYKERQPLVLEYFKTFLSCMRMIVGVWSSIYKAPYGNSVSFLPITNPKFHEIFQISGTLSVLETGYSDTMRDTHWCLTIS